MKELEILGHVVEDRISGFKGVAVAVNTYPDSGPRVAVQPQGLKDGTPLSAHSFDLPQLTVWGMVHEGINGIEQGSYKHKPEYKLGQEVKHRGSGIKGYITSVVYWLFGCMRYGVQLEGQHEGKPLPEVWYSPCDLEAVAVAPKSTKRKTFGPKPTDPGLSTPRRT